MIFSYLIDSLKKYSHRYPDEVNKVENTVQFIQSHKDCFYRSCLSGHITTSAWVVDSTGKKALLTHHKKIGKWVQLGGHVEKEDKSLLHAVRREIAEESGLIDVKLLTPKIFDLGLHEIPLYQQTPRHIHYDVTFLFQAPDNPDISVSAESYDLKWFVISDLVNGPYEDSVRRMAKKYFD